MFLVLDITVPDVELLPEVEVLLYSNLLGGKEDFINL